MHYKLFGWLIVALACGVGSSFIVKAMWQGENVNPPSATGGTLTQILVAKTDLAPGSELGPQNIRFDLVPENKIPRDAIFHYEGIAGRKVVGHVARNKPISLFDLEMKIETSTRESSFIPPGFSVVPIRIENVTSGGTFSNLGAILKLEDIISSGDRVSLSVLLEERASRQSDSIDPAPQRIVSKPLVENVAIYSVQTELLPHDGDQLKKTPIVSVLLDREKTNQVKVAMNEGKLRMTLTQGNAGLDSPRPGQNTDSTPIAVNILSNLGRFRAESSPKSPDDSQQKSGSNAQVLPVPSPILSSSPKSTPVTHAEKTAVSAVGTQNVAVKKAVSSSPKTEENHAAVKENEQSTGQSATASSNGSFLNRSPLKKQNESTVVETPKQTGTAPKATKAPQEKDRIQESNNGFRPRPASNSELLPTREIQALRPASFSPRGVPAVAVPRGGLRVVEENGVGFNF